MNIKTTIAQHLEEKAASLSKSYAEKLVNPLYESIKGTPVVVQQQGGGTIEVNSSFLDGLKESIAGSVLEKYQQEVTSDFLETIEKSKIKTKEAK